MLAAGFLVLLTFGAVWMLPASVDFWKVAAQPLATAFAGLGAISAGALAYLNGHRTRQRDQILHESKEARAQDLALRERFTKIAGQLADASPAIRLAAIYSLASLVDNWRDLGNDAESQACIDLFLGYLRDPIEYSQRPSKEEKSERELRQIAVRMISNRKKLPIEDRRSWADLDANLENASLPGCRLDGIDLSGMNLRASDLRHASFYKAALAGASFEATQLEKAIFVGAEIDECNFSYAFAEGANFAEAKGRDVNFADSRLQGAWLFGCELNGADFDGADMQKALLSSTSLKGASMIGAKAQGAHFERVDLTAAKLNMANLSGIQLTDAELSTADLKNSHLDGANLERVNFTNADLSGADLRRAEFFGAILNQANLSNADAQEAFFLTADLTCANLTGTNLSGAMIHTARLSRSKVSALLHVKIALTVFGNNNLSSENDEQSITVQGMPNMQGVIFSDKTIWPANKISLSSDDSTRPPSAEGGRHEEGGEG